MSKQGNNIPDSVVSWPGQAGVLSIGLVLLLAALAALYSPPTGRRFVMSLLLVTCGSLLSVRGWLYLDNQRRILSATLIGLGTLINGTGLFLWWATFAFPFTWGGWL